MGGDDERDEEDLRWQAGDARSVQDGFEQMPSLMAATQGPEHTIVAANAAFRAFVRQPDLIGRPARQVLLAFPWQQLADLLDLVYAAGKPFTGREWPVTGGRYLDFTLAPWRDARGGMRGVLVSQFDVTERVREQSATRQPAPPGEASPAWRETLAVQEAMLPSALPVLAQARVAARYLPAAEGAAGGDWFDAFSLPDGRLALMVGDVAGHGVAAATAMGQFRAVLRQALVLQSDLMGALAQADRFAAGDAVLRGATLCAAVLEPADGRFSYATCGHPPPLVAAPDGTARCLPGTGARPLGTSGGPPGLAAAFDVTRSGSAVLRPGEVLLLYSDGLVKRTARTLDDGLADLEVVAGDAMAGPDLAAWTAGTAAERVSHLTVEHLAHAGYLDDVTTLAVWRQPEPEAPLDIELPASRETLVTLRLALDGWLDELGVAFGDRQLAELSVIEVVTNAVEHAYPPGKAGPVRLEAAVGADGYLQTRVSDRGRWRVPDLSDADRGQGLSVAVQFAEELQVSHPPQDADEALGTRGTVIAMRHRLHRQPMLVPLVGGRPAARAVHPGFAVELVTPGPAPRVQVSGPVDFSTADRFAAWLLAACRAGVLPLTVDLSAVTILASAGVRVLYQVTAQLAGHGQHLTLISPPGSPAAAVLDLARLTRSPR